MAIQMNSFKSWGLKKKAVSSLKKRPMFSMDYIIPAIDLSGSIAAVQAGRELEAITCLVIYTFFFTPLVLRVKVTSSSTYCIYYGYCFYCLCSTSLSLVTQPFRHLSPPPQKGADGGWLGIVPYLLYWLWIYSGAPLSAFGNQDYFHTMIVLGEKLNRSGLAWCDQLVDLFRLEGPCFFFFFFSGNKKGRPSEWEFEQLMNKQTQFCL